MRFVGWWGSQSWLQPPFRRLLRWHRPSACAVVALSAIAQAQHLTLADAERIALQNHPAIRASQLMTQAANQVTIETRSANQPTFFGSITGVGASDGSRIAAGA